MLALLRSGELRFPPFKIKSRPAERPTRGDVCQVDATAALSWAGREYRFAVEAKARATPKALISAEDAAERAARALGLRPMLLVPYLSQDQLERLEARGISGLDLCGNGIVLVPGKLLVLRSGSPNRFRAEGRIKRPYGKNSSVVARAFLLRPEFDSIGAVQDEIQARNGKVTLGTVSKVVDALEEDLVVERRQGRTWRTRSLRLLQPEKLLDLLRENYRAPKFGREFLGKTTLAPDELLRMLDDWRRKDKRRVVRTGVGSVGVYATMACEDVAEFYCSDVASLLRRLDGKVRETDRFPNLRLVETDDDPVYFDSRPKFVASPVQTYLELAAGDKRDRETAEQVRQRVLAELSKA
jgi:hypothetical protein